MLPVLAAFYGSLLRNSGSVFTDRGIVNRMNDDSEEGSSLPTCVRLELRLTIMKAELTAGDRSVCHTNQHISA